MEKIDIKIEKVIGKVKNLYGNSADVNSRIIEIKKTKIITNYLCQTLKKI